MGKVVTGSAVCVYGAPRSQITYPHGALERCIDGSCDYIDIHQIYLNLPSVISQPSISPALIFNTTSMGSNDVSPSSALSGDPEGEPVLLDCMEGLDPNEKHRLVLILVEPNPRHGSVDGGVRKGMTLASITYTRVVKHRLVFLRLRSICSLPSHILPPNISAIRE